MSQPPMTHDEAMAACRRIVEARRNITIAKRWNDSASVKHYSRTLNDEMQAIDIEQLAHAVLGLEAP